jgi:hypothetical protein
VELEMASGKGPTPSVKPLTHLRPYGKVIPQFCEDCVPRRVMQAHMCPNFDVEKPSFQFSAGMINQISVRSPIKLKQIGNERFFKKLTRNIHATMGAYRESALFSLR